MIVTRGFGEMDYPVILTGDNLEAILEKNPNLTAQLEESVNIEGEIES